MDTSNLPLYINLNFNKFITFINDTRDFLWEFADFCVDNNIII